MLERECCFSSFLCYQRWKLRLENVAYSKGRARKCCGMIPLRVIKSESSNLLHGCQCCGWLREILVDSQDEINTKKVVVFSC